MNIVHFLKNIFKKNTHRKILVKFNDKYTVDEAEGDIYRATWRYPGWKHGNFPLKLMEDGTGIVLTEGLAGTGKPYPGFKWMEMPNMDELYKDTILQLNTALWEMRHAIAFSSGRLDLIPQTNEGKICLDVREHLLCSLNKSQANMDKIEHNMDIITAWEYHKKHVTETH